MLKFSTEESNFLMSEIQDIPRESVELSEIELDSISVTAPWFIEQEEKEELL